jgi:hypothetical protein
MLRWRRRQQQQLVDSIVLPFEFIPRGSEQRSDVPPQNEVLVLQCRNPLPQQRQVVLRPPRRRGVVVIAADAVTMAAVVMSTTTNFPTLLANTVPIVVVVVVVVVDPFKMVVAAVAATASGLIRRGASRSGGRRPCGGAGERGSYCCVVQVIVELFHYSVVPLLVQLIQRHFCVLPAFVRSLAFFGAERGDHVLTKTPEKNSASWPNNMSMAVVGAFFDHEGAPQHHDFFLFVEHFLDSGENKKHVNSKGRWWRANRRRRRIVS